MGHLFSRAFRRITQCSQSSRNSSTQQQVAEQQQQHEQGTTNQQQSKPVIHETIPVGQSIDSSEYRALNDITRNDSRQQQQPQQQQPVDNQENTAPTSGTISNSNNDNKQDVEEAVIKIQALVRGHLTRKALKDAHQQSSTPAQNALGQCQFDEESLTRNPPSAVFLPSSPLNLNNNDGHLKLSSKTTSTLSNSDQHQPSRTPLESIAELTETPPQSHDTGFNNNRTTNTTAATNRVNKHSPRLSLKASKLEMPPAGIDLVGSGGGLESPSALSTTPALSEAATSIDLDHEVPASASILISDHNIKPADRIASVLYFKEEKDSEQRDGETRLTQPHQSEIPTVGIVTTSSDDNDETPSNTQQLADNNNNYIFATVSSDSEEAAAIRIQSAFRGYRTRKNSPYRTRSPSNSIDAAAATKQNAPYQQDINTASIINERTEEEQLDEDEAGSAAQSVGRRASRQRHRDLLASQEKPDIVDEQQQQQQQQQQQREQITTCALRSSDRDHEATRIDDQQVRSAHRERTIQGAPSLEEFTTTEDTTTVKEANLVPNQQQEEEEWLSNGSRLERETPCQIIDQSAGETAVAAALESVKSDELNSDSHKADGPSLSLDINAGLLTSEEANTLDETGLSAALEVGHETTNFTDELAENGAILADSLTAPRPSEASVELDTDSSVLGAALSLNEDTSLANNDLQIPAAANQIIGGATNQLQTTMDDDKSQGVSLMTDELELEFESEARRLVDELQEQAQQQQDTSQQVTKDSECALAMEEAEGDSTTTTTTTTTNKRLEIGEIDADDDDAVGEHANLALELLNEEEQRVIELESDDIERRDPRGQASEERSKSPQIRMEPEAPPFTSAQSMAKDVVREIGKGDDKEKRERVEEVVLGTGANLAIQPAEDGASSGRSSPALNSSAPNSSGSESGDNSDNEEGGSPTNKHQQQQQGIGNNNQRQQQQQQQQQSNQQTGKNKKKNRKRRGKK